MLLYSLLHLTGYEVSLDEIKRFRQLGSITPGHPEVGLTPGALAAAGCDVAVFAGLSPHPVRRVSVLTRRARRGGFIRD